LKTTTENYMIILDCILEENLMKKFDFTITERDITMQELENLFQEIQ